MPLHRLPALSAALAALLTGGPAAHAHNSPRAGLHASPASVIRLQADSEEAKAVLAWVRQHAPRRLPTLHSGVITVRRSSEYQPTTRRRVPDAGPPIPLPATGRPGECIRIQRELGGGSEWWVFHWSIRRGGSGRWALVASNYTAYEQHPE